MKLWVNENNFVEIDDRKSLSKEIAPRSRSLDWMGISGFLPDPDPILRKSGQDMRIYRELLSDAHVWSCCQSRKSGTLSCEWELRESEGGDKRAYKTIADMMDDIDVYQTVTDMLDAPFYGMSPLEVMWKTGAGKWLPAGITGKPPEWFVFSDENQLRFLSTENMTEGEELPEYKFLLPRHHASYQNPYGERVLSRCFWPVVFKKGGLKFWSVFTEKFGMPWVVGKVPRDTNETERGQILTMLTGMVQDAVAVVNDDQSIEFPEVGGKSASAEIYEKLISTANREISKAILGQTLTTEIDKGGSYAATKEHMNIRADLVDQDQRMVSEAFNLLFKWVIELNFSEGTPAPVFVFHEEEDVQSARAERDKTLSEQGVAFTKSYYSRVYSLEEDDFEVVDLSEKRADMESAPTGQFSEKKNGMDTRAVEAQDAVDELVSVSVEKAASIFEIYKGQIKTYLSQVKDLKTARDGIIGLYSALDSAPLPEALTKGLIRSDQLGVESISSAEFAETQWGKGKPFSEAIDFFRAKSFTIAGVSKADLLGEVKDEIIKSMQTGGTLREFRTSVDDLFIRSGYDRLSPYRIDTIFRTNMQGAYQAGRYRQMTSPAVTAARPYWRYVAVMDAATRPEHRAMHGKIFRHDHPIWQTWYPPNGFNCRCFIQTVSESEMKKNGWKAETKDPTGDLHEIVDISTGEILPAKPLLPDEGWGSRGGDLEAIFTNKKGCGELGAIRWKETKNQPGPKELKRPLTRDIPDSSWKSGLPMSRSLEEYTAKGRMTESAAIGKIESDYKKAMGISPNETFGTLKGPDGEIVKIDLNGLAHAMLKRGDKRERYIKYFRDVIENPYEILLTEYETAARGNKKFRKKYIGLYERGKKQAVIIIGEISREGWAMWDVMQVDKKKIDKKRTGRKVLYGQQG